MGFGIFATAVTIHDVETLVKSVDFGILCYSSDPMKQTLLLAYLGMSVLVGRSLAPHWQNDVALWQRTVSVAPHHARAMVNLADALNRQGDHKSALFWAASARQHAHEDLILPERERRTVIMAANSNMVSILLAQPKPKAPLITELLEEIWQLQSRTVLGL